MLGFGKKKANKAPEVDQEMNEGEELVDADGVEVEADESMSALAEKKQGGNKNKKKYIALGSVVAAAIIIGGAGIYLQNSGAPADNYYSGMDDYSAPAPKKKGKKDDTIADINFGNNSKDIMAKEEQKAVAPSAKNAPKAEEAPVVTAKEAPSAPTNTMAAPSSNDGVIQSKAEASSPAQAKSSVGDEAQPKKKYTSNIDLMATAGNTKIADYKVVTNEIDVGNKKIQDSLLNSLEIGGNGTVDPFLQQYQTAIDNKQKIDQLKSNVELMESAYKYLDTKLKYDQQAQYYKEKIDNIENAKPRAKIKEELNSALENMQSQINQLRDENSKLKSDIENGSVTVANNNNNGNGGSSKGGDYSQAAGFVKTGDNISLSNSYNGQNYLQSIYRIGDNFIMEEIDENGNITVYRPGMNYRGTVIKSIGENFLSLQAGDDIQLVSVGNSGSGASSTGYNYITIGMPSNSSIKNAEQERTSGRGNNGPRDYSQVVRERQDASAAAERQEVQQLFQNSRSSNSRK
jgi:hypothetical protein